MEPHTTVNGRGAGWNFNDGTLRDTMWKWWRGSGDAVTTAIRSNTSRRFERASRLRSDAGSTVFITGVSAVKVALVRHADLRPFDEPRTMTIHRSVLLIYSLSPRGQDETSYDLER